MGGSTSIFEVTVLGGGDLTSCGVHFHGYQWIAHLLGPGVHHLANVSATELLCGEKGVARGVD